MTNLFLDIRYALRQLGKNPGFTAVAVLTLALGIGANTAIFSLMNAIMLRTLPVHDPKSLVSFRWTARNPPLTSAEYYWSACPDKLGQCVFSYPMFKLIRAEQRVFSNISAFMQANTTVHYANHSARSRGLFVSGDFFSTLGGRIAMGRSLNLADDTRTAPPVVVVSQQFWQRAFNGDPGVIGKPIFVGKAQFTVIGVATSALSQLDMGLPEDFWRPLAFQPDVEPNLPKLTDPTGIWLGIIARLKPGVSARQATAETDTTFAAAATHGLTAIFKPADSPHLELPTAAYGLSSLRYRFFHPLFVLLISVAIVLLIACANIAGLMLVRSATRRKEIATRSALGATRARIVRQLFTESILLSIAGGGAGIMLGYLGAHAMAEFLSVNVHYPLDVDVHPDPHVLGFTLLVSLLLSIA